MRGPVYSAGWRQDRLEHRPHLEGRPVELLEARARRRVRRHRHEVAPQLLDEERGVLRMAERQRDGVTPRERASLAEDHLRAGVVALRVEAEVGLALAALPRARPASQGPRLLAHVALAVAVPLAEREQLHQLAAVVLVRRVLRVVDAGEPHEHRRVGGDREQELAEVAERETPQEPVLRHHQLLRADTRVRRGEPVVPVERHPLDQRPARAHHPVEPPEVVVAVGVAGGEPVALLVARRRPDPLLARRAGQREHGCVEPELCELRGLAAARAEAGTPEQALRLGHAEGTAVPGDRRHADSLSPRPHGCFSYAAR